MPCEVKEFVLVARIEYLLLLHMSLVPEVWYYRNTSTSTTNDNNNNHNNNNNNIEIINKSLLHSSCFLPGCLHAHGKCRSLCHRAFPRIPHLPEQHSGENMCCKSDEWCTKTQNDWVVLPSWIYTQIISKYPKFFVSGPLASTLHRIGNNVILDRYTTWSIANGSFGFLAWLANDLPTVRSLPPEYPGYEMSTCIEIP